jgi:hypothetical protein
MVGAVIYVRVSTKEQAENLSLPTQLRACEEYCRRQGYEILEAGCGPSSSRSRLPRGFAQHPYSPAQSAVHCEATDVRLVLRNLRSALMKMLDYGTLASRIRTSAGRLCVTARSKPHYRKGLGARQTLAADWLPPEGVMPTDLASSTRPPTSVRALPAQMAAENHDGATERPRGSHAIRTTKGIDGLPLTVQLAAASLTRASQFRGYK